MLDHVEQGREAPVVVEAALRVRPQASERRSAIAAIGSAVRLDVVDSDLRRRVQVPAGLGSDGLDVTLVALRLPGEKRVAVSRSRDVETAARRRRRRNRELVEVQVRELRRDAVVLGAQIRVEIPESVRGGDRKLARVVQARVPESALSVHLEVRDEGIPVGHRTPSGPGVEVHAREAEGRRNERRRVLAVEEELGVELSRAPARHHRPRHLVGNAEQGVDHGEIGREVDDLTDVQIAIGPAVEPASDPGREGVVHCGVAEGALDSDGL